MVELNTIQHDSKNYRLIKGNTGMTISEAVKSLHEYSYIYHLVCMEFNGVMLYSDTVTMDSAYTDILGMTSHEFRQYMNKVAQSERLIRKEKQNDRT